MSPPESDPLIELAERVAATGSGQDEDPVEVVNFYNPHRPSSNPASEAIRTAIPIDVGSPLRCVRLPYLIALKLYAGGRRDQADVVELLRRNPSADSTEVRSVCAVYGSADQVDELWRESRG